MGPNRDYHSGNGGPSFGKDRGHPEMAGSPKKRARRELEHKGGHGKGIFKAEFCDQAYQLCLLGATDAKIGEFFSVSETTINNWKLAHPAFRDALKRGKEIADAQIAEALFHRAKGFSHPEDDIRTISLGNAGSEIVITPTVKHYPPDTQAASLWLRNRQPHLWKEKQEVEVVHLNALHLDALRHRQIAKAPEMVEDVTPKEKP